MVLLVLLRGGLLRMLLLGLVLFYARVTLLIYVQRSHDVRRSGRNYEAYYFL